MDKYLKRYLGISSIIISFFFVIIASICLGVIMLTINIYNILMICVQIFISILLVYVIILSVAVYLLYERNYTNRILMRVVKLSIKKVMPILIEVCGLLKINKDDLRHFFIKINNTVVGKSNKKYLPCDILMIFPHCLQSSSCVLKITNNIYNCKQCGKCGVGEIVNISKTAGIDTCIVTGGTAARNILFNKKPKIVIAVACERDLMSGIIDAQKIPVLGILNQRPNGPCLNTCIDISKVKKNIEDLLY